MVFKIVRGRGGRRRIIWIKPIWENRGKILLLMGLFLGVLGTLGFQWWTTPTLVMPSNVETTTIEKIYTEQPHNYPFAADTEVFVLRSLNDLPANVRNAYVVRADKVDDRYPRRVLLWTEAGIYVFYGRGAYGAYDASSPNDYGVSPLSSGSTGWIYFYQDNLVIRQHPPR